jgi:hypothetical protein
MTRRTLLKSSLGAAVLIAAPDLLLPRKARAAGAGAAAGAPPHYFLYGFLDPIADPGPSVRAGHGGPAGGPPAPIAAQLAALPVKSPDQTRLALVSLVEQGAVAAVNVTVVDTGTADTVATGTLRIPGLPDAVVLATPAFAADSATVALVLSVTVPTSRRTVEKPNPLTGGTRMVQTATWVSHHLLAYFNCSNSSFAGPFDLGNAPSLARVNAAANAKDLFLWSMLEPAAVLAQGRPVPTPQLSVFPLGSGKSRVTVPASEVWPVNDEPTVILGSGAVARLADGRDVELYARDTGRHTTVTIEPLAKETARPTRVSMELRADGLAFISNPGLGRAVLADPARSFKVVSSISHAVPASPAGGPAKKAVLSADAKTLYAVGTEAGPGISAYDVGSGKLQAVTTGREYTAIYPLASGTLLAVATDNPRLSFFDLALRALGTVDTPLNVVEVY